MVQAIEESLLCLDSNDLSSPRSRGVLTNAKMLTDAELQSIAALKQLESLELGKVPLLADRLDLLGDFAYLKSLRLVPVKEPFTVETQ